MGTWNTAIIGNDNSLDIYQRFFDLYNQGKKTADISGEIQQEFADEFEDYECRNNCLFGLALAQWETKSLELDVFNRVKQVIDSDEDIQVWKTLGADKKTLKQRRLALDKFLSQITKEREKPKRKIRPKSAIEKNILVDIIAPDLRKTFTVSEEYNNKTYIHTSAIMKWEHQSRPVFFCKEQGENISAEWNGAQMLIISYDKNLNIIRWDNTDYFDNDEIVVIYNEI